VTISKTRLVDRTGYLCSAGAPVLVWDHLEVGDTVRVIS